MERAGGAAAELRRSGSEPGLALREAGGGGGGGADEGKIVGAEADMDGAASEVKDEAAERPRRRRTASSTRYEYCACGLTVFEQSPEVLSDKKAAAIGDAAGRDDEAEHQARRRAFSLSGARSLGAAGSQTFIADHRHGDGGTCAKHARPLATSASWTAAATVKTEEPSSPLTSRSARTISVRDIQVDIEDMVLAPAHAAVKELAQANPKVRVSGESARDRHGGSMSAGAGAQPVCRRCQRDDCLTVRPKVGMYTMEHIRRHASADDCWIVAHGEVYDVTRYLHKHPGGMKSILSRAGDDATADYEFHTKFSKKKLWPKYKIGTVAVCRNRPAKPGSKPVYTTAPEPGASSVASPVGTPEAATLAPAAAGSLGSPGAAPTGAEPGGAGAASECGDRESTISKPKGMTRASARRKHRPRSHLARPVPAPSAASQDGTDQEGCVVS